MRGGRAQPFGAFWPKVFELLESAKLIEYLQVFGTAHFVKLDPIRHQQIKHNQLLDKKDLKV